jgi:hypothetical protein
MYSGLFISKIMIQIFKNKQTDKIKEIAYTHRLLLSSFVFFFFFSVVVHVFATPLYSPGETLDPSCVPGSTDCTVGVGSPFATDIVVHGLTVGRGTAGIVTNTVFGKDAGLSVTTGDQNTFLGDRAGNATTTGAFNVFIGSLSGYSNTEGVDNIFVGESAGYFNTTGSENNFIGNGAGASNVDGYNNIFIGSQAGYGNIDGHHNSFIGFESGYGPDGGNHNVFFGYHSGYDIDGGTGNIFIGSEAGLNNTTGSGNVFVGRYAGEDNISGTGNTYVGLSAGENTTSGLTNSAFGYQAGLLMTDGEGNSFLGYGAGFHITTGDYNVAVGRFAGSNATTGSSNTFLGASAGAGITTGTKNTIIGANVTGLSTTLSNTVIIADGDGNKRIYIDNAGKVGIGTVTPNDMLEVTGNIALTNDGTDRYIQGTTLGTAGAGSSIYLNAGNGVGAFAPGVGGNLYLNGGTAASGGINVGGDVIINGGVASTTNGDVYLASVGGYVAVGFTGTPSYKFDLQTDVASSYVANFFNNGNNSNRLGVLIQSGLYDHTAVGPSTLVGFQDGNGTAVGSITFGSSATAYNTTSDQRLKNLVNERTNSSLNVLNQIQIHDFTWKDDVNSNLYTGVFAQELYDIYPHAVTKPIKDTDSWMVDYSKLTPIIISSIQDLDFKITQLSSLDTTKGNSLGLLIKVFLSDAGNTISDLFAKKIHTEQLCVKKSDGTEFCANGDQLETAVKGQPEVIVVMPTLDPDQTTPEGDISPDLAPETPLPEPESTPESVPETPSE